MNVRTTSALQYGTTGAEATAQWNPPYLFNELRPLSFRCYQTCFGCTALLSTNTLCLSYMIKIVSQLIDFNTQKNPDNAFCKQGNSSHNKHQPKFLDITYFSLEMVILVCQADISSILGGTDLPMRGEKGNAVKRHPAIRESMQREHLEGT